MKVVVLSGSDKGAIGYFVRQIHEQSTVQLAMVVVNAHQATAAKKSRKRQLKKVLRIGVLGAINGIRMRKWFGPLMHQYLPPVDLKSYCTSQGIPLVYTPATNHAETVRCFQESGASLGLSLGNDYIASKVFSVPKYGMINLHGEILPDYQNAQSVIWQIHNGSNKTGYTIHKVSKKIDGGDILYQEAFDIEFRDSLQDTVSFNCAAITKRSASGLVHVLNDFENYLSAARPQGSGGHYTTPSIWQFARIYRNYRSLRSNNNFNNKPA